MHGMLQSFTVSNSSVYGAYLITLSTRDNTSSSSTRVQHSDASILDLNNRFAYGGTG